MAKKNKKGKKKSKSVVKSPTARGIEQTIEESTQTDVDQTIETIDQTFDKTLNDIDTNQILDILDTKDDEAEIDETKEGSRIELTEVQSNEDIQELEEESKVELELDQEEKELEESNVELKELELKELEQLASNVLLKDLQQEESTSEELQTKEESKIDSSGIESNLKLEETDKSQEGQEVQEVQEIQETDKDQGIQESEDIKEVQDSEDIVNSEDIKPQEIESIDSSELIKVPDIPSTEEIEKPDDQQIEDSKDEPIKSKDTESTETDLIKAEKSHEHKALIFKSISKGPYSISEFIPLIELYDEKIPETKNSYPTIIENFEDNIYIGTSIGEILHYKLISNHLKLISRKFFHQLRRFKVTKILILKSISKILILSGNLLTCFNFDLEHSNIGRIKDVNDISLDYDNIAKNDSNGVHCVIFSVKQIRIINVTKESLRLVKDISYAGIKKGLRRGKFATVTNGEFYDLIDLDSFSKIPLFPISTTSSNDLIPFILPIGSNEFLLTCGTLPNEPAMGIIINNNGDVSRGTLSFDSYPTSIEVDKDENDLIIVSFKNYIKIYSIETQEELQKIEYEEISQLENLLSIGDLNEFIHVEDYELVELIKLVPLISNDENNEEIITRLNFEISFSKKISKTNSKLFILNNLKINLLKPISKLIKLNNLKDSKILLKNFNEIQLINNSNELNFIELEYLNLLIVINGLDSDNDNELIWESLINGTIDPRIFCYLMNFKIFGDDIWVFNGIFIKFEIFRNKKIKTTKINNFFNKFLNHWIKIKQSNNKELNEKDFNVLKTLELTKLNILTKENDFDKISEFINSSNISNYEESSEFLVRNPLSIANIHIKNSEFKQAIELYKNYYDEINLENKKKEILLQISELIYNNFDDFNDDYVNDLGVWLINKNSEIGLNFLQRKKLTNFEFELIINKIDDDSIKFKYIKNLLVNLNNEKLKLNLIKNLKKSELKRFNSNLKSYSK